jgi:hypothetical protein
MEDPSALANDTDDLGNLRAERRTGDSGGDAALVSGNGDDMDERGKRPRGKREIRNLKLLKP